LLEGVWKLEGTRRNTDKGRCHFCEGEEDVKHILLDCLETSNWRMKFFNNTWLNMNKEIAYKKTLWCTNKGQTINLGRYLQKVKYKWPIKQKKYKYA
jgi:hypothetical protein